MLALARSIPARARPEAALFTCGAQHQSFKISFHQAAPVGGLPEVPALHALDASLAPPWRWPASASTAASATT